MKSTGGTLLQLAGPDWGAAKGRGARRKKVMTARRRLAGQGDTQDLEVRVERRTGERQKRLWVCLPQKLERLVIPR